MKKVFVSGQLDEAEKIKDAYQKLKDAGHEITHDWTESDIFLSSPKLKMANRAECGLRAEKDINGVVQCDVYILFADNKKAGKGMYVELGAAIALNSKNGAPDIYMVGKMNHMSVFYLHPAVKHRNNIDEVIEEIL